MSPENKSPKEISGHDYDGIRELDNPTPSWWQIVFALTIVFGIGYFGYYQLLDGPTQEQELEGELAHWRKVQADHFAASPVDPKQLEALVADKSALEKGHGVFTGKCASCHGAHGEGLIGPNLTDDAWIHGDGKTAAVFQVVRDGVAEKGMPPWGTMLAADELMNVAAYVRTLRGSNPANAKPPQGNVVHE